MIRKKFASPEKLGEAVEQIARIYGENPGIAVCGGYAMYLYGSDRLTADVDFIASEYALRLLSVDPRLDNYSPLSFGGIQTLAPNGVEVDIICRNDDYEELYHTACLRAVLVEDVPVPVVSPIYLAAMKMAAGRPKDQGDLHFLLREVLFDKLPELTEIVKKYLGPYAARELQQEFLIATMENR